VLALCIDIIAQQEFARLIRRCKLRSVIFGLISSMLLVCVRHVGAHDVVALDHLFLNVEAVVVFHACHVELRVEVVSNCVVIVDSCL